MSKWLTVILGGILVLHFAGFAQSNEWGVQFVTLDDAINGTGDQTPSVAAVGENRFVALVTQTPASPVLENLFDPPGNYLVGYWDADSAEGRVPSPINGEAIVPDYNTDDQFTDWESGLDKVTLKGAYQLAGGDSGYVYVANNDENHNILVFQLTETGVMTTDFRMETGTENIFGIEVDDAGFVYVVDYQGSDAKDNEVKVYAGFNTPGTGWSGFGNHTDDPTTTIDLPPGTYQGITVSGDGTMVFVSATSERSLRKYVGDPENGYTLDTGFEVTLAPEDTIANGGFGTPSFLGLAFLNDPPVVFAAVDSFIHIGGTGGYPYGRVYSYDAVQATPLDTLNVAEWNLAITGAYDTGSSNGRAGGYTSVVDVDVEPGDTAVYTQTYYGWAVEKWVFEGTITGIEQVTAAVPEGYVLKQNYPNPFNPATTIEFSLKQGEFVTLEVFNLMGQKVETLVNESLTAGTYRFNFDASGLASGIYLYQLKAGDFQAAKKMILLR